MVAQCSLAAAHRQYKPTGGGGTAEGYAKVKGEQRMIGAIKLAPLKANAPGLSSRVADSGGSRSRRIRHPLVRVSSLAVAL